MTPIKFVGDEPASTERVETGWHSFDRAFEDNQGHIGFPLRSLTEVYGAKSVGKTSFCLSIMGRIAVQVRKNITVLDLEVQDRGTVEQILVQSGFEGEVHYIMNDAKETPEETLSRFTKRMLDKNPDVSMIDSIGGYRPNAELDGEIGDRNVGQKALEMGQFSGRLIRGLQLSGDKPNAVFMTNHLHPKIGFMALGNTTTGGETKKYLSTVRIALSQHFLNKSAVSFGTSWLIKGKVDNNRFGYSGREFYLYMIGGEGVHLGLTAMWDCILAGYADLSSKAVKESTTVTMDGVPYGKLATIIRDRNSEPERFNQFINVLKSQGLEQSEAKGESEEE